jgi:cytochrome P450
MEMKATVPGPRALPFVGGMLQLRGDPLERIRALRARHGGFVRLGPLGPHDVYLVTDPAAVRHVLADHHTGYKKGKAAQRLRPVLGQGSLLLEGEPWRRRRRLVQPAFHKQKAAALADSFVEGADAMLARWQPGATIDARDEMLALTMALTLKNMFRSDAAALRPLVDAWQYIYDDLTRRRRQLITLPAWVPDRRRDRASAAMATVHRVLGELIRACQAKDDDGSVLAMLVRARDEGDGRLGEAELRDEVMTVFVGGYETSSNGLAFAIASLAAHPEVAARQREEIDRVLGDRAPTGADLAALPYNRAVLQESLRLYPPSWLITREALADDVVAGYPVARGAQLLISIYGVHHAPDVWPDPERFLPDRFLDDDAGRDRFAYLPFGGGPRLCMGDQYAMTEMQLVLARLAQKVTLALAPGVRIEPEAHVGLRPRHPLRVIVRPRQTS